MIHSNAKDSFSLIEVMFALAIFAIMMVPIFTLQNNLIRTVGSMAGRIARFIAAEQLLWTARQKQPINAREFTLAKKDESRFKANLSYKLAPLAATASLNNIKGLCKEEVTIDWLENGRKKNERLITFVYRPEAP